MPQRPGGSQARRPLHFFWLLDASASMATNGKIDALNNAVRATLPALVDTAAENPFSQLLVRALSFNQGTRWHIPDPTPVESVSWTDLEPFGRTDMGLALRETAAQLTGGKLSSRSFPPAIVLVSDGRPTDDFDGGLNELLSTPWGRKAVRVAVAIGGDADLDVLARFTGDPEIPPLTAGNPDELVHYLRWLSTAAARVASRDLADGVAGRGLGGVSVPHVSRSPDHAANQITW